MFKPCFFGNLLVGSAEEHGGGFQNGNFRAHAFPHRAHFQTDDTCTDNAELGRHLGQIQRAFVIQHVHVVDVHQGQRARGGAGGHDDVFAFNRGFCAFVVHFQLPEIAVFAHEGGRAEQAGYFVFLKQEFNPAGELGDDGVFALDHLGGVKLHIAHGDAVFGKVVLRGMEMLGRLQQSFGRNTAHV